MWSDNDRRYLGHIDATRGDIIAGFCYDISFCDGDKSNRLRHTDLRALSDEVSDFGNMALGDQDALLPPPQQSIPGLVSTIHGEQF
jgi:hypothetical protein